MANAFFVYPAYSVPEYVVSQNVEKVSQVQPYRKYERGSTREKDKKKGSFSNTLESEKAKKDKRWETGDVSADTEIGDPGFFFDYKT